MRRLLAATLIVLLAGCSHARINASVSNSSGSVPAAGTSVSGGGIGVQVHSHSLAALVIAGMVLASAIDYSREPRPFPSFSSFADWFRGTPPPPELAAERRVLEHDCTRPLPESAGNLKCR